MNRPLQVGITGGIGSGKSLVCRIFKTLGVPIYDADSHARNLMTSDPVLVGQIKSEFGEASYEKNGTLNRGHISSLTFGKKDSLEKLNSLVHPRVAIDYSNWSEKHKKFPYLIREAALLYEAGSYTSVDKMIVVSAPENVRLKRVSLRDPQRTESDIKSIMLSQWPEEEKLKRADFIIYNDDQRMVIPQVLKLHDTFISLQKR
ncbi:MAG: dephospho-CoA kinase [Cyclobacteriaceae bacterium]|nr:dephospho-CoA kinase [Cyclobacteriaceae bacterium]